MHKVIYLDTNIFLHYQPFDQINWLDVVKADSVTIVVPPVTIRELNKHKDSHLRSQLKKRAGETIKRLTKLFDAETGSKIGESIVVRFEDRDPFIDFSAYQLNVNVQDDHLIASILTNILESPDENVVLLTSDMGLTFMTKAGRQGIGTLKMPENLRLADEADPNEIKVKQLEQQVNEMKSKVPKLALVFSDGNKHAEFGLTKIPDLEPQDVAKVIEDLKKRLPKREWQDPSKITEHPTNDLLRMAQVIADSPIGRIPKEEIDRYNKELDKYFESYASFLYRNYKFESFENRMIRLDVILTNAGTTPAEDIDIYMHFPDALRLLQEHELPQPSQEPHLPVRPMTEMEQMASTFRTLSSSWHIPPPLSSSFPSIDLPSNVSGPTIKKVNSYEVHVHVQKAKHNLPLELDPLFVVFDQFETANSFKIDYRILTANIPQEVLGNLHVIINKE